MWEDNLLAVQPKAFVITTDSDHNLEVYLNLASRMKFTGVNQLWWPTSLTFGSIATRVEPIPSKVFRAQIQLH